MTSVQHFFKRALMEKIALMPMDANGAQQATGPDGAPVDPMAGGAPGGAPMDPMAGGAPMDPAATGGMPPMPGGDPMAGGMPPMPGGDPMAGLPPPPEPVGGEGGGEGVTKEDAETVDTITRRTLDIVRETLDMVGKTKTPKPGEAAAPAADPTQAPGPVTGQPGFDPAAVGGPLKMAAVLSRAFKR